MFDVQTNSPQHLGNVPFTIRVFGGRVPNDFPVAHLQGGPGVIGKKHWVDHQCMKRVVRWAQEVNERPEDWGFSFVSAYWEKGCLVLYFEVE